MKVKIVFKDDKKKTTHKLYLEFIKFIQKNYPLKYDLTIELLGEREGVMTTGSRNTNHTLKVLTSGRMNRDILRTLAHEWIHEYQRAVLKRPHGPDIGGVNEDEANAISGQLMKIFEKEYPELEDAMYE